MFVPLQASASSAVRAAVVLQSAPDLFGGPLGNLLIALVIVALVLFVGRFVLSVAWRILRIAIVVVALVWLLSVVAPMVGL